ncbi:MAG TPA: hypothetical protein VMW27_24970 [Thermoanaerobaculia bacterium]|nr:hypothetical protein [Thermoanaerobaculia bacterium]
MDTIARRRFQSLQKIPSEIWQFSLIRLPTWVFDEDTGEPFRPTFGVCLCPQPPEIVMEEPAGPEDDLKSLADRTLSKATGRWGRLPGTIQTSDPETAELLRSHLADAEVRIELAGLPLLDEMAEHLLSTVWDDEDDPRPEALSAPGVTVEQMAAFAGAAARFFAAAPWRHLTAEDLIRIESPEAEPDLRYAVVAGAERGERGLIFFDSPALWEAFSVGDIEAILETGYWSVSFDEEWDLVPGDLVLWERHGLPRSGDLYPVAVRLGEEVERPAAARLAFFEGMLEALAATTEEEMDTGRWEKTVTTHRGALRFTLALPDLLEPPDAIPFREPDDPVETAWDLLEDALDAPGRRRRLLARRALGLDPDCVDAYLILAEMEPDLEARRDLLTQGMAIAERVLGPRTFEEEEGSFWRIPKTRPYMVSRLALAQTLRDLGEVEDAVGHMEAMLRLNPEDGQGVRYPLLVLFLEAERHEEAEALLDRYPDDVSPSWLFSRALLAFREEGDSPAARDLLRTALESHRDIAKYLLDPGLPPLAPPDLVRFPKVDESILYVAYNEDLWEETPGALAWLARRRAAPSRSPHKKPKPKAQAKPRRPKKKKRR